MEIQFTIKLLDSSASAATLTDQGSSNVVSEQSLGSSAKQAPSNAKADNSKPDGKGGGGQDNLGSGGGAGAGLGQVIVIGPIVIGGALAAREGAGSGGAGQDPSGPGGQGHRAKT